jgi:hypothetical protein
MCPYTIMSGNSANRIVTVTEACNGLDMWWDEKYVGLQNICGKIIKRHLGRSGRRWQEGGRWMELVQDHVQRPVLVFTLLKLRVLLLSRLMYAWVHLNGVKWNCSLITKVSLKFSFTKRKLNGISKYMMEPRTSNAIHFGRRLDFQVVQLST